jgi:DNA-binding PadR family transcriptional regulator
MSTKLMVLGVLYRHKKTHGYQILRDLTSWQAETWTKIRPGSIYHALMQMTKEGLLTEEGIEEGGRGSSKTLYSLTREGENELVRLIEDALISYDQEVFTAGLAFMSTLPRVRALKCAEERLANFKKTVAFLEALPRDNRPETPKEHSAIISSWSAVFSSMTVWQERFVEDVKCGVYEFSDNR